MGDLHLPLKAQYFDDIKARIKSREYRLRTRFWSKRIEGRTYDRIILTRGYPKATDTSRRLVLPWLGYRVETIVHPHFGNHPVEVLSIDVTGSPLC